MSEAIELYKKDGTEEIVRAKWPRAVCWTHGIFRDMLAIYDRPRNEEVEPFWGKMLSKTFHETEAEAWADAAARIKASETAPVPSFDAPSDQEPRPRRLAP